MKILGYINPDVNIGKCKPEYPLAHSGVVFVIGTAPSWKEDLEAARAVYPDADLCAVNEAVLLVEADHIATSHDGRIKGFHQKHLDRWGYRPGKTVDVHYRSPQHSKTEDAAFFSWDVTTGAGSAPFAAAVMALIGYDLVIFCGCPMDGGGGYAEGIGQTHKSTMDDPRFGLIAGDHGLVQSWKVALRNMPTLMPELTGKWRSMSGYTQQIFGGL
jgi:hypothetical protein